MIRCAIVGYGNLGRGVEKAVNAAADMELVAVVTRRNVESVKTASNVPVIKYDDILTLKGKTDVLIICGGSATDLPEMTPYLAEHFTVVDSFDNHHHIPEHYKKVNDAAFDNGNTAVISAGWDPGMFSIIRAYASSFLPSGSDYTFWGRGVSQGHSDAIRRIDGVANAKQYTVPVPEAMERVRKGENPELSVREKHKRECYVVAKEGADKALIEQKIKTMPDYFADYDTTVNFISAEEFARDHSGMPHGGSVFRTGTTSDGVKHMIEFSLTLDSNPEFTGSILCATARAAVRMNKEGKTGCKTVFDIPPAYFSPLSFDDLLLKL